MGQEHKLTVNAPYTGRELFVLDEPLCRGKVLISPDRQTLVTCGEVPKLWDVHTGQFLGELSQGEPIVRAAFSNRGNYLVTATSSGVVQLWDVQLEATPPEHIWHQVRHQLRWTLEDGQLVPKLTQ